MKIKVIDLLNKIVNSEEVSGYIRYYNRLSLEEEIMLFCEENILHYLNIGAFYLNDEVEITEEPKNIEKVILNNDGDIVYYENGEKHRFTTNKQTRYLAHKMNEIIDYINNERE